MIWKQTARFIKGKLVAVLLLYAFAVWGCAAPSNDGQAKQIALQYYELIRSQQFDKAVALFPPETQQQWLETLQRTHERLGNLTSYSFSSVEMNTVYSGKYYLFITDAQYETSKAGEILTLFAKVTDNKLYIVSRKLNQSVTGSRLEPE